MSFRLTICEGTGRLYQLAQRLQFEGMPSQPGGKNDRLLREPMRLLPIRNRRWAKMGTGEDLPPALNGRDPSYHRYHSELFAGQEVSCWEKHQMEREIARTTAYAA
jgi:hypothetical protein